MTENEKIISSIAVIETKLDDLKKQNDKDHTVLIKQVTATNGRVRSLEIWKSFIIGGLTIISAIVIPMGLYILSTMK